MSMPRPRRLSGPLTITAIFALGIVLLALLWRAPRSTDTAPEGVPFAVPASSIRIVCIDRQSAGTASRMIELVRAAEPDVVVIQNLPIAEVHGTGLAIGMSRKAGDIYYPAQNLSGPAAGAGNAIYSRFPLYEGRSIPNRGGSFGVWAVAAAGDVKFMIASVQFTVDSSEVLGTQSADDVRSREIDTLVRAWHELGDPPMLLAGIVAAGRADESLAHRMGAVSVNRGEQAIIAAAGPGFRWRITPLTDAETFGAVVGNGTR